MAAKKKIQIANSAHATWNGPRRAASGAGSAVDFTDTVLSRDWRPDDDFAIRLPLGPGVFRGGRPSC